MDILAHAYGWKSLRIEDPPKKIETFQKALQSAENAKQQFSSISFISPRSGFLWTGSVYAEYYVELAASETDGGKRRGLLEKAVTEGNSAVKLAEKAGYPEAIGVSHHVISKALASLAQLETDHEGK